MVGMEGGMPGMVEETVGVVDIMVGGMVTIDGYFPVQ
jgi:hypothetical protein